MICLTLQHLARIYFASNSIHCYSNLSHMVLFSLKKEKFIYINMANLSFKE